MIKYITPDITMKAFAPQLQERYWDEVNGEFVITHLPPANADPSSWALSWASPVRTYRNAVMETGFFFNAAHIDQCGLYGKSSLNTDEGIARIRDFEAPKPATDIVFAGSHQSKYDQVDLMHRWNEVVLAAQVALDRSVKSCGTTDDYWAFVEGACKRYGERLFIKLHPRQHVLDKNRHAALAQQYGATCSDANMSVIWGCKFLLVYCSTMAMDAFIRNIPVVQYAPGYWHETGAVTFTGGSFTDYPEDTQVMGRKVADFCIWRYCFNYRMPRDMWWDMLRLYAASDDILPMTDEFCYAQNTHWSASDG